MAGLIQNSSQQVVNGTPGPDEHPDPRPALPLARLSAPGNRADDRRHALHRQVGRSQRSSRCRPTASPMHPIRRPGSSAASTRSTASRAPSSPMPSSTAATASSSTDRGAPGDHQCPHPRIPVPPRRSRRPACRSAALTLLADGRLRPEQSRRARARDERLRRTPSRSCCRAASARSTSSSPAAPARSARARSPTSAHFAQEYRQSAKGPMIIAKPANNPEAGTILPSIRRALAEGGVSSAVVTSYAPADPTESAPVRLSFAALKAEVATQCGRWPGDLSGIQNFEGWKNTPYENFGCASQSALAMQVADPLDLERARPTTPPSAERTTTVLDQVQQGPAHRRPVSRRQQGQDQSSRSASKRISDERDNRPDAAAQSGANRPAAARFDPGLLRDERRRPDRSGGGRRSPPRQGACQDPDGRHRRGGRGLSQRADAERHHHRERPCQGRADRRARPALAEACDSGHQGRDHRPYQRRPALSRADRARRQRIHHRPGRRARHGPLAVRAVPRPGFDAARPHHRRASAPRAASAPRRPPTMSAGASRARSASTPSSSTWTSPSAPPG